MEIPAIRRWSVSEHCKNCQHVSICSLDYNSDLCRERLGACTVARYEPVEYDGGFVATNDGDWVKYNDHKSIVQQLKAKLEQAEAEIEDSDRIIRHVYECAQKDIDPLKEVLTEVQELKSKLEKAETLNEQAQEMVEWLAIFRSEELKSQQQGGGW